MGTYDSGVRLLEPQKMKRLRKIIGAQTHWKVVPMSKPSAGEPAGAVEGGDLEAPLGSPFKPSEAVLWNLSKQALHDLIHHWNFLDSQSCCLGHAVIRRLHNLVRELEP